MSQAEQKKNTKKKEKTIRLKKEYINPTPPGEKKNVSDKIPDSYDPPYVEAAWYDWWEKQGYFKGDVNDSTKENFVMVIPPPNVTGTLHMGHALTNSIQDALARWHRMSGKNVLWVPGTDHAGIATQVVVEKKIKKEQNLSRHDLGREKFIAEVWKWKENSGATIGKQLRRLGSSLDWEREVFTMDEKLSKAVTEAFVRLYDSGKIYRKKRLVNWCCELKTAISDIEVDKKEIDGKTRLAIPGYKDKPLFGVIISFAYKVEGSDEEIIVETTRLETMLGDTAVAIHPEDPRYKHLHGKFVIHPFDGRKIPIVTDKDLVDMKFGTGAVKVTPAHDPNDYACGIRNKLEMITIFDDEGTVNENGGIFKGLKRFDARVAVMKALQEKGLFKETKPHKMVLPICSRTGDVIEPILKPQWWVDCAEMAAKASAVVKSGDLKIVPEMHTKKWFSWLDNIQDWCISRQLWWGHRVPAYLISIKGQSEEPNHDLQENYVCGRSFDEAKQNAIKKFPNVDPNDIILDQDPDVLDTWFSSGLFPFSVFGWPENTQDLQKFYPTSLLETGHDILFFWVARMVMLGMSLTDKLPFNTVFLHAMVRDAHGRKMSKSLGNVLDPIDVTEGILLEQMHEKLNSGNIDPAEIEKAIKGQKEDFPDGISECGTDAMRFALCAYTAQGKSINLDINRVVAYRNFCNKIWNATKFFLMFKPNDFIPDSSPQSGVSLFEKWILSRLSSAVSDAHSGWSNYNFAVSTSAIYDFWLYELCDVFLEVIKPVLDKKVGDEKLFKSVLNTLYTCLDVGLKLLHPFMPFVTEELFQRIPRRSSSSDLDSIMISKYPLPSSEGIWSDSELEKSIKLVMDIVHHSRSLRTGYVAPSATPTFYISFENQNVFDDVKRFVSEIQSLIKAGEIVLLLTGKDNAPPNGCAVDVVNQWVILNLYLKGLVDPVEEIKKLEKKMGLVNKQLEQLQKRMSVATYEAKVPAAVKQTNSEKVVALNKELENLKEAITKFESLKN